MAACFVKASWRRMGAGLVLACLAAPVAMGQSGVVFVGDDAPTAQAGPQVPTLKPSGATRSQPRAGGDPRYLNSQQIKSGANGVSRADYARAISQQITETEAKPKRGFFSRLGMGFGRGDQPDPAPKPAPNVQPRVGGVQPAAYVADSARGTNSFDSAGTRERTGLFSWGSKPKTTPKRQPARTTKPAPKSVAKTRPTTTRPTGKTSVGAKKQLAQSGTVGTRPPAKKLASPSTPPAKPAARRMPDGPIAFATDPPAKEKKLPRPFLMPAPANKPAAEKPLTASLKRPNRPIAEAKGPAAVRVKPQMPKPAPIAQSEPTLSTPAPSAPVLTPEDALMKAPVVRSIPPRPSKPAAIVSQAKPSNPVPPPVANQPGPSPRAVEILAHANQLAQRSQSEADFTLVAQHCRHVQAIDNSPAANAYSRQLASWALNKRGEARADAGRSSEAMTDFDDALALDPTRWRAIHNRGVLLAQSGSFAEAFEAFNQTLRHNPKFAKAYSNRAALFVQAGDFASAMEDYRRAIDANPDLAIAHKGQGRVCHMLGKMDQALRHMDAAALLSPKDASVLSCRADLLVDMGRYAAAVDSYQRAIAVDPAMPSAYRNLAWLQATCPEDAYRDAANAVANATQALELAGVEDDISLDTLAAAQAASGDFESAASTIRKAIALAPAGDQAVYAERLSLYQSGQAFTSSPVAEVQQAGFDRVLR
ncbi:MAG: tetratricopeptide repeat protein [Planctomycetota bacterium]